MSSPGSEEGLLPGKHSLGPSGSGSNLSTVLNDASQQQTASPVPRAGAARNIAEGGGMYVPCAKLMPPAHAPEALTTHAAAPPVAAAAPPAAVVSVSSHEAATALPAAATATAGAALTSAARAPVGPPGMPAPTARIPSNSPAEGDGSPAPPLTRNRSASSVQFDPERTPGVARATSGSPVPTMVLPEARGGRTSTTNATTAVITFGRIVTPSTPPPPLSGGSPKAGEPLAGMLGVGGSGGAPPVFQTMHGYATPAGYATPSYARTASNSPLDATLGPPNSARVLSAMLPLSESSSGSIRRTAASGRMILTIGNMSSASARGPGPLAPFHSQISSSTSLPISTPAHVPHKLGLLDGTSYASSPQLNAGTAANSFATQGGVNEVDASSVDATAARQSATASNTPFSTDETAGNVAINMAGSASAVSSRYAQSSDKLAPVLESSATEAGAPAPATVAKKSDQSPLQLAVVGKLPRAASGKTPAGAEVSSGQNVPVASFLLSPAALGSDSTMPHNLPPTPTINTRQAVAQAHAQTESRQWTASTDAHGVTMPQFAQLRDGQLQPAAARDQQRTAAGSSPGMHPYHPHAVHSSEVQPASGTGIEYDAERDVARLEADIRSALFRRYSSTGRGMYGTRMHSRRGTMNTLGTLVEGARYGGGPSPIMSDHSSQDQRQQSADTATTQPGGVPSDGGIAATSGGGGGGGGMVSEHGIAGSVGTVRFLPTPSTLEGATPTGYMVPNRRYSPGATFIAPPTVPPLALRGTGAMLGVGHAHGNSAALSVNSARTGSAPNRNVAAGISWRDGGGDRRPVAYDVASAATPSDTSGGAMSDTQRRLLAECLLTPQPSPDASGSIATPGTLSARHGLVHMMHVLPYPSIHRFSFKYWMRVLCLALPGMQADDLSHSPLGVTHQWVREWPRKDTLSRIPGLDEYYQAEWVRSGTMVVQFWLALAFIVHLLCVLGYVLNADFPATRSGIYMAVHLLFALIVIWLYAIEKRSCLRCQSMPSALGDIPRFVPLIPYLGPYICRGWRSLSLTSLVVAQAALLMITFVESCVGKSQGDTFGQCRGPLETAANGPLLLGSLLLAGFASIEFSSLGWHAFVSTTLIMMMPAAAILIRYNVPDALTSATPVAAQFAVVLTLCVLGLGWLALIIKALHRTVQTRLLLKRFWDIQQHLSLRKDEHNKEVAQVQSVVTEEAAGAIESALSTVMGPLREATHAINALTDEVIQKWEENIQLREGSAEQQEEMKTDLDDLHDVRALARRIRKLLNAWDSDMSSKQRRDTLATAVARAQSHVSRGMLSGGGTEEAGLLRPSLTAAVSGNSRSSAVEATMDQPTLLSIRAADAMSTSGGRSYEPILSAGTGGGPPGFRSGHGWNVSATDVTINIPPPSTSAKPLLSSAIHTTGGEHPAAISSADDLIRAAAERLLQRQRASGSSNAGSNGGGLLLASPSWSSPSAPATRVARMHREHTVGHAPAASEESSMRFIGRHPGIQRYASANVRSMAGAGATTFGAMRFTSPLAASSVKTTPSLLSSTPTPSTGKATPMSTRSGQMGVAPGYTGGGASMRGSEGSDSAHHRHAPTETDLTQSPPSTEDTARGYGMSVSTAVPTSGVHVEPLFGGNRLQKHVSDGSGGDALRRAVMLGRPPPDLYVSPQGEPLSTRSLGAVLSPAVSSTSHAITAFTSVSPSNSGYEAATSTSRNESPHYPPWSPSRTELVLRPLPHPSDEWQRPVPTKLSDMSRAGVPQNAVEEGGAQQTMVHLQHGASLSHLLPPHATMLQGQTYLTHAVQTHGERTGQAVSASEGVVSPSCGGYVSDKDYESDSSSALSPDQYTLSSARNSGGRAAAAHFKSGAAMLPRPTASGADAAAQPSASSGTSASLQAASARGTQTDGLKTELAAEGEQRLQAPAVGEAGALIKSASFTVGGNVSDEMHGIIPGSQHPSRPDDSYVYDYAFEHEYRRKRQGVAGFSHLPIAKMPAHHHPTAASTFVEEPKPLSHALGLTRKLAPVTINGRATDASTVLVLGWKPQETADVPAPTGVAGPQPPPPDKSDSTQPSDRHVSTSSSSAVTISAGAPEIILPAGASSTSGGDGTKRGFGDGAVSGKAGAQPFATAATSVSTTFMAAAGASGGGMHAGGTTVSPFSRGGSCVSPSAEGETPQSMRAEHMAAAAGGPKRAPSHPPLNLHVLVVDDEEVNRKIAARFLKRLGCTYTLIDDGDRVVEALLTDTRNFDVILMDILMQRTNGLEVCKSLRDQQVEIPIIAVTAAFSRREQAIYQLAGFDDVLPKPFSIDDLYHSMILARRIQRQRGVAPLSSADM